MVDIVLIVPLDNEISLLGRGYGATSEGGIDVEGSSFRQCGSVNNDVPNIVEGTPVTPEVVNVNLTINR
jgi:hypothetical protein